jgi:hypothetical protein
MKVMHYSQLDAAEMAFLVDPANRDLQEHWEDATVSLASVLVMLSPTYPKGLLFSGEEREWDEIRSHVEALRGTPLHERLVDNLTVARDVWREWEENGHSPQLHEAVDSYLEALYDESVYLQFYPEDPPPRRPRSPR